MHTHEGEAERASEGVQLSGAAFGSFLSQAPPPPPPSANYGTFIAEGGVGVGLAENRSRRQSSYSDVPAATQNTCSWPQQQHGVFACGPRIRNKAGNELPEATEKRQACLVAFTALAVQTRGVVLRERAREQSVAEDLRVKSEHLKNRAAVSRACTSCCTCEQQEVCV